MFSFDSDPDTASGSAVQLADQSVGRQRRRAVIPNNERVEQLGRSARCRSLRPEYQWYLRNRLVSLECQLHRRDSLGSGAAPSATTGSVMS